MNTLTEFQQFAETIEKMDHYERPQAFGLGIATLDNENQILDTYFPLPNFQQNFNTAAILSHVLQHKNGTNTYRITVEQLQQALQFFKPFENDAKKHGNIELIKQLINLPLEKNKTLVATFIAQDEKDAGPQTISDAYLRLHLLSHRLVKPHEIKVNGIFGILPLVAWTSIGPINPKELASMQLNSHLLGKPIVVHSVDKFPRMVDYVVPTGVRIADASRVRLGAYLGEGTVVMHEGFVNFNAGCEGPNMIEGRVSAGVFVKKGSDLGGGCSTMGTLSGGGNIVISIGENCLIGANAGVGIPLGNRCTIESGLYITPNIKVLFQNETVKARTLAGKDDLLFRRNSTTGQVEAILKANDLTLNAALH